jgi:alpha-mannosidase
MADETLTHHTPAQQREEAAPSPSRTHLLIVPHTHWDREWYQTFQQFRMRLVRAVDLVLDTLERDRAFAHFTLDGQTIVLEDYLEVRPENARRLERLARAGRLLVGPWYLQPDEYLVGGESLIRNLALGRRQAAAYGGAMSVGYVPDTFGHIAQLPQILRGFELENAVFWRGVGPDVARNAFRWAAPDGTDVLALWLHDQYGYSNAAVLPLDPDALTARLARIAESMRPKAVGDVLLLMNGSDHQEPQTELPAVLAAAAPRLAAAELDAKIGTLPQYVQSIAEAGLSLERHSGELRSGFYSHLLPGVLSTRMWLKQANAAGEALLVRWTEPAAALAALWGAPHPTALLALAWKHLMHNHPHDSICGCGIDQVHAEMLPRFAQSAQIAEELTAQALAQLAAQADTSGIERAVPIVVFNPGPGPRTDVVECALHVPFARFAVVDGAGNAVPFQVASEAGSVLLDEQADPLLVTAMMGMIADGRALGYAILDAAVGPGAAPGEMAVDILVSQQAEPDLALVERTRERILALAAGGQVSSFHIVAREAPRTTLLLLARDVPAIGGRVFFVHPAEVEVIPKAPVTPPSDALRVSDSAIENAHLAVEVDAADGTLTLRDKRTGRVYAGLNQIVDTGDVGDLYNWSPPASDCAVTAPLWPPSVELIEAGPARATLRIRRTYALPAHTTTDRRVRSGERVTCAITTAVSLTPGARRVELRTTVENTARDHRMRALFPLPFAAEHADAEGTFEVARRPARLPGSAPGEWNPQISSEQPVNTFPQKRFVDVSDGEAGLALLNRGLPEYELLPAETGEGGAEGARGAEATLALTLLRAVEWLSRDDLATRRGHAGPPLYTPEAQGLGTHVFEYALVPHSGGWRDEDALVLREAAAFEAGLRAAPVARHAGPLGDHWSAVYVTPASVVVSAVKRPDDGAGLIVRLANPTAEAVEAEVILGRPFSAVEVVNLAEDRVRAEESAQLARILTTGIRTPLREGEIRTLRFRFDEHAE